LEDLEYLKHLNSLSKFLNKIKQEQKSHAYLLTSEDEVTLAAAAKLFVLSFECEKQADIPCFSCANCIKVLNNTALDVFVYPKKNSIVVEDVKEIVETTQVKPMEFSKKFYILNNFSLATIAAQNKLLKTLEEPPQDVIFILTASSEKAVLPTIASRVKKLALKSLSLTEIKEVLKTFTSDSKKIAIATENSGGNLGKAISLLNDEVYFEVYNFILNLVVNMKTSKDLINYTSVIEKNRKFINKYLEVLSIMFRDMLIIKQGLVELAFNQNSINLLNLASEGYSQIALLEAIKKINKAKKMLKFNTNVTGVIDSLLLGILEVKYKWQ
jgi:DNA polymerase III subunit delta'